MPTGVHPWADEICPAARIAERPQKDHSFFPDPNQNQLSAGNAELVGLQKKNTTLRGQIANRLAALIGAAVCATS
jgi:hypothetical protein